MNYKIINDSMLNMLNHIEENSIDCIITDPPYGLTSITKRFGKEGSAPAKEGKDGSFARLSKGFMGKEWDGSGIEYNVDAWRKCFSALKDGGYLLAFGGTRTFHRIACAIEDAGFELRDTIMWLYGSGFPKSHNIGLSVDKKNGIDSEVLGESSNARPNSLKENNLYQAGTVGKEFSVKQATNEWQGWGTALKPAFEPIIVARKPIKTSVAENVLKNRVGGINIDECRVPANRGEYDIRHYTNENIFMSGKQEKNSSFQVKEQPSGRFPANIIHDGSDEVVSGFPDTKSTEIKGGQPVNWGFDEDAKYGYKKRAGGGFEDEGSASRFFYTAKASKKDRDEGLEALPEGLLRRMRPDKDDNNPTGLNKEGRFAPVVRKNTHPTVKPCELMQYLVRLVAPKGATILDPFMGSGSTGKAVMFENRERNADYKFIGIDLEKEYCEIAEMRIDYALNKYEYDFKQELQKSKEKGQISLFGVLEE